MVLAVLPLLPGAAVCKMILPEPPVPVPSDAAKVRVAPATLVPAALGPRSIAALGVALPSPAPKTTLPLPKIVILVVGVLSAVPVEPPVAVWNCIAELPVPVEVPEATTKLPPF